MLSPICLKPQKHVYGIVCIYVHIFRYFMQYYDFQPPQQHKYLYISDHLGIFYQTILVFMQNSNIFVDHLNAQVVPNLQVYQVAYMQVSNLI